MYLLNYAVYKPPDSWKATHKSFLDNSVGCGVRTLFKEVRRHLSHLRQGPTRVHAWLPVCSSIYQY